MQYMPYKLMQMSLSSSLHVKLKVKMFEKCVNFAHFIFWDLIHEEDRIIYCVKDWHCWALKNAA